MSVNNRDYIKFIVIFSISILFFLGFLFRENAVGGGPEFYILQWPIIQSFKKDFLFTISNYGTFGDGNYPFYHIVNAYLNPFSKTDMQLMMSVTVLSFFVFIIFAYALKKIFYNTNYIDIILLSSTILLLPFFRTSAFWAKVENFGWFFFVLALFFFNEVKKSIGKDPTNRDIFNSILFCFTSACALYSRQAMVFLPISYLLFLLFNNANKKIILSSIISFFVFSIPGLLLIWFWGDIFDTKNLAPGQFQVWVNPKNILKNLPILLSFFGFYLLPILFLEFLESGFKNFFKKYFKSFFFSIIAFTILGLIGLLDYLGNYTLSGGAVLKINYLIKKGNYILLLIFSSIGFSLLFNFLKEDFKNNSIILIPLLFIHSLPKLLYQEYAEPLILIIFFLGLNTNLHQIIFKKISRANFIIISYFAVFIIGSIYFKHFAFKTYDKWMLFLTG